MALGFDITNSSLRLMDDLISYQPQIPISMSYLTVEESIEFWCRFRGIPNRCNVIKKILADYDLNVCAQIRACKIS